jgi:phosphoglycerate dehydrogenase-like enzyme
MQHDQPPAAGDRLLVIEDEAALYAERIAARCPTITIETRAPDAPDLVDAIARANLLLAWTFPAEAARAARRLEWVQSMGAGVDHLLAIPNLDPRVPITRVGSGFGPEMAEYVLGYLLALSLRAPRALEQQRQRQWRPYAARLLRGRTALVVGLGTIGSEVARLLRAAGLYVLGVSRRGAANDAADETWAADALDCLLPRADVLVIVVPLTAETRRLIDTDRLALLPRGAWLVNVSRGAVLEEAALVAALQAGQIGAAVLDVFEVEPLPAESPLWTLPDVIVTPHIAGPYAVDHVSAVFAENYRRLRAGEPLLPLVDRERGY